MNVERAEARRIEHRLRQDQAVGGDDEQVCLHRGDPVARFLLLERFRLENRQPACRGQAFHGAGHGAQSATRGPVGLRQDECDFVTRGEQRGERALGEFRRSGEDEAQESSARLGADA
jgi:hypothetical protein